MGGTINDHAASEADYAALRETLTAFPCGAVFLDDGVAAREELAAVFDVNGDGKSTLGEIAALRETVPASRFSSCVTLLKKHGYDPFIRAEDFEIQTAFHPRSREWKTLWDDRNFVLTAVDMDGASLRHADRAFRSDEAVILAALPTEPEAFLLAAKHLRQSESFCLAAVVTNGLVFEHLPGAMKRDKDVALAAVKNGGHALGLMGDELRADRDIVLAAVRRSGTALAYAPETLRADPEIVRAALATNGLAFGYADVKFRNDPEAVLIAVKSDYHALHYASKTLLDDPHFMEKAVKIDGLAFGYASDLVKRDPRVLDAAVAQNPLALVYADPSAVTKRDLLAYLGMHWIFPPDEVVSGDAAQIISEWRAFTAYPERFGTMKTFLDAWVHSRRLGGDGDDRPVALLLYNTNDWNGAFAQSSLPRTFLDSGKFRVVYREVSSDEEAQRAIAETCAKSGGKIHTLVLAGHGQPKELGLGKGKNAFDESSDIDRGDFKSGVFRHLDDYVDESGQVLLYACSNGQGGKRGRNLANAVARRLPPSVRILSSRISNNLDDVTVKDDLSLEIQWIWGEPYDTQGLKERKKSTRDSQEAPVTPSK